MELWEGAPDNNKKKNKDKRTDKNSSNSINSNSNSIISQTPSLGLSQQMNNQTTALSMLPPPQMVSGPNQGNGVNNSDLIGLTPSKDYENFGPMAANEALGGSGFGASNW